jgi:aminocarboxymuconate-semialdehyde decarboxylase
VPIDVHAHYVPATLIARLEREASPHGGVSLVETEPACHAVRFAYGVTLRPFFAKLTEEPARRLASMDATGIDRQLLSTWCDLFGHGLDASQGAAWHRTLNETLGAFAQQHPHRFSLLASAHLPDAAGAARELEHAVTQLGAVGAIASTNVEGVNLGDLPLDEFWAAAVALDAPVFLHPMQATPTPRTRAFGLNTIAQYTFDTTLAVGSLIGHGVLDRFPALRLILAHGGGTFPYLAGRFDVMFERSSIATASPPSAYLDRFVYDTLLHDAAALRYLTTRVGVDRLVIGTDDGFPPADRDPLASLRQAGFTKDDIGRIADENPRRLFSRLSRPHWT